VSTTDTATRTIDVPGTTSIAFTTDTATEVFSTTVTSVSTDVSRITSAILVTETISDSIVTIRTLEETFTSISLETSVIAVPTTTTRTAVDSSLTVQTLQETQTPTDVQSSTHVVSTVATQTAFATITAAETARETLTSLQIETSFAIVPTISVSIQRSILTLVRSGTTFTAESILTSYVTISLSDIPATATPGSQPAGSIVVPESILPSGSGPITSISEGSSCSSYGPSTVPNASVCGGTECRVEYELGSYLKWQQFPEKPPVVTELVFVSMKSMSVVDTLFTDVRSFLSTGQSLGQSNMYYHVLQHSCFQPVLQDYS
jgi:hypothetical protein